MTERNKGSIINLITHRAELNKQAKTELESNVVDFSLWKEESGRDVLPKSLRRDDGHVVGLRPINFTEWTKEHGIDNE